MNPIRRMLVDQSPVGEPERRGDERSEAPRSGGSSTGEREGGTVLPDPEVPVRHAKRRFTTGYKLEILRKADACTRSGEIGALLRKEGLYSSHLVTWRRQRTDGLSPKKRDRKAKPVDPQVKRLEQENRRLTSRLQKADALLAFQKNGHARRCTRIGMKVVAWAARARRAKVDAYWCPEPGKKWTRVLRPRHPILLPSPRAG